MIYDKEFLISELHRFYDENDRVPMSSDMLAKNGYPAAGAYQSHFGTWNNALEAAGFEINKKRRELDGTETCSYCGKRADEIPGFRSWVYPNGIRHCEQHGANGIPDYIKGNLDKNSSRGKATISEQVVKNVLNIEDKHDCNFAYDFNYKIDLYHKDRYKYINVKDSKLHDREGQNHFWYFDLTQKELPDTYVMLGYDEYRKNILHVWITDAVDDLVFNEKTEKLLKAKTIMNSYKGLKNAKPWEVDPKPYDDMLRLMSRKRKETNGKECFLSNDDLRCGSV